MNNLFYRAFEDLHRGSRELILDRLRAYLPFLHPLASALAPAHALDLGCGRGEWLELLSEQGFTAQGVDLDEGMLEACRERGLDVRTQDALSALRAQADGTLALVSAFHLVEHIDFDDVQALIVEAMRVLIPGGLLILETPNPENLVVATSGFYMDPSHLRPIPPQLLEFVVEFHGFKRHRIARLQEPRHLNESSHLALLNVLNAVSPDYSVVAQKAGPDTVTQQFDSAFSIAFGLTLESLAERYDAQHIQAQTSLQHDMAVLGERVRVAEQGSAELFRRTLETIQAAQAATQNAQHEIDHARQRERHLEEHAHRLALHAAEARVAQALSQADATAQRLLLTEQRALHAERQLADAEQAATIARKALQSAEETAKLLGDETESLTALQSRKSLDQAQRQLRDAEQLADEAVYQAEQAELSAAEAEARADAATQQLQRLETELAAAAQRADATQASIQQLSHELAQAHAEANQLRARMRDTQAYANGMEERMNAMYASSSWRMTKPARAAMSILLKVRRRPAGSVQNMPLPIAQPQPASSTVPPPAPPPVETPVDAAPGPNESSVPARQAIPMAGLSPEAEKVFQQLRRSAQSDQSAK